jgi:hypothetical protein
MNTTHLDERVAEAEWALPALPPLALVDRVALRVGVALILWGRDAAVRADRREQARRSGAARAVDEARTAAVAHRYSAGPVR